MKIAHARLLHVENVIHHELVRHSTTALRLSVGAVFLGFGFLKYFPGVSPAENLTKETTNLLTFGVLPGGVSIVGIATLECFIGICLLSGRWMRLAIWLLAIEAVGILSPLVLLPGRLFAGPHHAPTLEGQYVLKDIVLLTAGMVIAAVSFRGGRLIREDAAPGSTDQVDATADAGREPEVVLDGVSDARLVSELSHRYGMSGSEFHAWRRRSLDDALSVSGAARR